VGRLIDLLSFYVMAGWDLWRLAKPGDIIVAKTDPPLLSVLAALIARLRGARLVSWLQDIYPEVVSELGVGLFRGPVGRWLIRLRDRALRQSALNVAIGEDMAELLRAHGAPGSRVAVVTNWADDKTIRPIDVSPLRASWGLQDKFVVAYSGNLGRAHDVNTFLGAATILMGRSDIVFLFIGSGYGVNGLRRQLEVLGITNVQFRPYQKREDLAQSLCVADVHWLSLQKGLDGLILPSKLYGIAAAGRPMIVVSAPGRELARLPTSYDCGIAVPLGDSHAFANAIIGLAGNLERCHEMGRNARRMLDANFTKARSLKRWENLLNAVASERDAGDRAIARAVAGESIG
jgi:glycosyltransferase involved in cell wall biosynthesis